MSDDESNVVSMATWFARRASAERAHAVVGPTVGDQAAIQLPAGEIVQIQSRRCGDVGGETTSGPGSETAA